MTTASHPFTNADTIIVISGGEVLDVVAGTTRTADIRIQDGRILEIGTGLDSRGAERIDATGQVVMPGLIDAHVHLTAFSADFRELERKDRKSTRMNSSHSRAATVPSSAWRKKTYTACYRETTIT